jgi:hypothetical protein
VSGNHVGENLTRRMRGRGEEGGRVKNRIEGLLGNISVPLERRKGAASIAKEKRWCSRSWLG